MLATSKPISWFEQNLISLVPWRHGGAGRRVYPGFMQLSAFMSMNKERHADAFRAYYRNLVADEREKAEITRAFYAEYMAVSDLSADFYLETVRLVFQEYALPLGQLTFRGRPVDLKAIRRTALLTIEGEKDDICSIGQTLAAHDLCTGLGPTCAPTTCRPASATTASSAASAGRTRSTRWCAASSTSRNRADERARRPRPAGHSFDAGMKAPVPPLASGAAGAGSLVSLGLRSRTRYE